MVDNQEDADSLCCYQCRGAIIIRWQVNVHALAHLRPWVFAAWDLEVFNIIVSLRYMQGTRARSVATWALCSQAQRYYKHVQRAHGKCACAYNTLRRIGAINLDICSLMNVVVYLLAFVFAHCISKHI